MLDERLMDIVKIEAEDSAMSMIENFYKFYYGGRNAIQSQTRGQLEQPGIAVSGNTGNKQEYQEPEAWDGTDNAVPI